MTGSLPNSERAHTTPLKRDNSRVNQTSAPPENTASAGNPASRGNSASPDNPASPENAASPVNPVASEHAESGGPGETTRPAFHQPGPAGGRQIVPAAAAPPSNPGQVPPLPPSKLPSNPRSNQQLPSNPQHSAPQHSNQHPQGNPYGNPPSNPQAGAPHGSPQHSTPTPGGYASTNQQPLPPPPAPQPLREQPGRAGDQSSPLDYLREAANAATSTKVTPMGWVVRGLALLGVSLVSGLLWLAIKPEAPGTDTQAQPPVPKTVHQFDRVRWEESAQSCQAVATSKIKKFFVDQECEHLTRALYSVRLPDGQRVLTSIVTVLMPNEATAKQLEELTTTDGTGNIKDLVDEGRPGLDDFPTLGDKGYSSALQGRLVVIGDSAYFDKKSQNGDPQLSAITQDALQLGWPQDKDQ